MPSLEEGFGLPVLEAMRSRVPVLTTDRIALGEVAAGAAVTIDPDDPVALARDTALLARYGYRHAGTEVLDLFPHTHHVEAVASLVRK